MNSPNSFPGSARLKTPNDFKLVFKQAKKLNFREFTVYIRQNELTSSRLGLAISKKSAKKAVTRNTIKRIIRESFRLNQNHINGWDIVFVSRPAINTCSREHLHNMLHKVWKRLQS